MIEIKKVRGESHKVGRTSEWGSNRAKLCRPNLGLWTLSTEEKVMINESSKFYFKITSAKIWKRINRGKNRKKKMGRRAFQPSRQETVVLTPKLEVKMKKVKGLKRYFKERVRTW